MGYSTSIAFPSFHFPSFSLCLMSMFSLDIFKDDVELVVGLPIKVEVETS